MAKIGDLEIDTIKIKGEAVTEFFPAPTTNIWSITVSNPLLLPISVYVKPDNIAASIYVRRESDLSIIGRAPSFVYCAIDWYPTTVGETYTSWKNTSQVGGKIMGAVLLKR